MLCFHKNPSEELLVESHSSHLQAAGSTQGESGGQSQASSAPPLQPRQWDPSGHSLLLSFSSHHEFQVL